MEEAIKRDLINQTNARAFILKTIQEDPALRELAKQVVTSALTRTLRPLEEKQ